MTFVMLLSITSGLTFNVYAATPTAGKCGENAFWNYDVDSKTLSISGTGAMNNYSSPWEKYKNEILTVTIEDGITSISRSAFSNCSSLKTITIPSSVTYIKDSVFSNCSSLIDITIPEGVTKIGTSAFSNCSSLKTITIPNSVNSIGYNAFYGCDSLETVYFEGYKAKWNKIDIQNGNDSILKTNVICKELKDECSGTCNENISWKYSPSTKTMTFSGKGDLIFIDDYTGQQSPYTWRDTVANEDVENIVISDGITYVGIHFLQIFNNVKRIDIGKSVKRAELVNDQDVLESLKEINVDSENPYITSVNGVMYSKNKSMILCYPCAKSDSEYKIIDGVKSIEANCFSCSTNLKKISIPNSVKTIGYGAFSNSGIVDLVIPDSVNLIEYEVFDSCKNLKTVKVGNGVNRIETFSNCKNLESIEFGNSVEYISGEYGESLKTIVLPKSLKQIGSNTFKNCYNLKDVYYSGNESDWNKLQIGSGNDGLFIAQIHYNSSPSNQPDVTPNPGGSTGGNSTAPVPTPGGSSGGGGGFAPAPTPEDTDKKDEDEKPETKPAQPTAPTDTTEKPASVKVNKAQAKKKALVVYWNKIANVSGYQIQVATDKKFKKNKKTITVAKQNASKKTVKKLKTKKKYFVRVRAYKIVDGKKVYGKWSKIKSVKTK